MIRYKLYWFSSYFSRAFHHIFQHTFQRTTRPKHSQRSHVISPNASTSHTSTSHVTSSQQRLNTITTNNNSNVSTQRQTAQTTSLTRWSYNRPPPPEPPLQPTPAMACNSTTDLEVLWWIARHEPSLRRWIVANPNADAELLEFISQAGGPYVKESLQILLDSLND